MSDAGDGDERARVFEVVGNAVPPPMMRAVAERVAAALRSVRP